MISLSSLAGNPTKQAYVDLLIELGYYAPRGLDIPNNTIDGFYSLFGSHLSANLDPQKAGVEHWDAIYFLCQLSDGDISQNGTLVNSSFLRSCLFFVIELKSDLDAKKIKSIVREINKVFLVPVFIIFRYKNFLSLAIARRRQNKLHEDQDVIGDVALLFHINVLFPKVTEIKLISDLSYSVLKTNYALATFDDVYNAWFEVLSVKQLTSSFYRDIRSWISNVVNTYSYSQDLVTLFLLRFVFIYYCKEKKILPAIIFDKNFIKGLLQSDSKPDSPAPDTSFFDVILEPVFALLFIYNTESTREHYFNTALWRHLLVDDSLIAIFKTIPFLGGDFYLDIMSDVCALENAFFFSDYTEKRIAEKKVPPKGLVTIFSEYVFSFDDVGDDVVSITPDFLGTMFEHLATAGIKKDIIGVTHTPSILAERVVIDALAGYLTHKLSVFYDEHTIANVILPDLFEFNASRLDNITKERLIAIVCSISIADLCCGSGVFLLHALDTLCALLSCLDPDNVYTESAYSRYLMRCASQQNHNYTRKMFFLSHAIYGVDVALIAVRVTRLRFFLSLLLDGNFSLPGFGLPNLAHRFILGDSLVHANPSNSLFAQEISIEYTSMLQELLFEYFHKKEPNSLSIKHLRTTHAIPEPQTAAFDPKTAFGVADFSVIVGNPPYIPLQTISNKNYKELLRSQNYTTYTSSSDIYALFIEQALRYLVDNGVVSYIVSNKFFRSKYGAAIRKLLSTHTPLYLTDLGANMFNDSVVVSAAITIRKGRNTHNVSCATLANPTTISAIPVERAQKGVKIDLHGDSPISIVTQSQLTLKGRIECLGVPLGNWSTLCISRGVITGFNAAYIITSEMRERLVEADERSAQIILPLLRGRDIARFGCNYSDVYLIKIPFGTGATLEHDYPVIYAHLVRYKTQLQQRGQCVTSRGNDAMGQHHWAELDNNPTPSYFSLFTTKKLIYPETTLHPRFYLDTKEYYVDKTGFVMVGDGLEFLTAMLGSPLLTWYYKTFLSGADLYGGSYQYNKHAIEKLPVPRFEPNNALHKDIVQCVIDLHTLYSRDLDLHLSSLVRRVFRLS